LASFQTFFAFVLLQQIFASIRQGNMLAETITDFWSPHESIHERARNALPQYGASAIGPLLVSLRSVACLTKEQRDQLPAILAAIGPSAIPALIRHLNDAHEHMRTLAVASLGQLHALDGIGAGAGAGTGAARGSGGARQEWRRRCAAVARRAAARGRGRRGGAGSLDDAAVRPTIIGNATRGCQVYSLFERRDRTTPNPASRKLSHHTVCFAISTGLLSSGLSFGFGFAADLLGIIKAVIFLPSSIGARSTVPEVASFARTESNTLRPSSWCCISRPRKVTVT
jgi:hypothetical protein